MECLEVDQDLIFDVGLHNGQDSEFYLKKGFKVVAIEANPQCVEVARKRLADYLATGQLVIETIGIGREEKICPFYVNGQNSEWSSFTERLGTRGGKFEVIEVQMTRFPTMIERYGMPYYLKIDIEGMDSAVIESLWQYRDRPKFVSYETGPNNLDALALLRAQGYRAFKLIDQYSFQNMRLPDPPREGQFVDHSFELGSSGPFGEETAGPWRNFTDVAFDYVKFWAFERNDRRYKRTWCDFHAKRP